MDTFLHWLAAWRGIEVEAGTSLKLELSAWPAGGLGLLVLLGLVSAVALVIYLYRRDGKRLTQWQRVLLASLRCVAVVSAILILLEPNLVAVTREERPGQSLLLLDLSQSMGHSDSYRRNEVQDLRDAWRGLGVESPATETRFGLAKALLGHDDNGLLNQLSQRNDVLVYGMGSGIEPIPLDVGEDFGLDVEPGVRLDLGAAQPKERYTNLGGAVRAMLERSRDASIASVVILSDGRRNLGPQGAEVARLLAQRKVAHTLVLGIGDPSETQFLQLTNISAPEKVFQKDPFRVVAKVASQGYERADVSVRLLRTSASGLREVVRTQSVEVGGESPDATVEFDQLTATEAGIYTYGVEIQPSSGIPFDPDRHVARTQVEVLGEQTVVLMIAGGPSHEYRFLRDMLTRDKTIELRCWLSSADADYPQDGNVSIKKLPVDRSELESIDVVLLIDPNPNKLTHEFCELVAHHVVEEGGGLWWVSGEKFTLNAAREGATTQPLTDLLPVVLDVTRADRRVVGFGHAFERTWPYELTPEGKDSKVVRLAEQRDVNATIWSRLPGYHFAFPVLRAKPLATTLVRMTNPELANGQGAMPMLAQQFVGSGRVLFSATDEIYRWRSTFQSAYDRLWIKGIRYLFEGRLSAGSSRVRLRVNEEVVELGEAVRVTVEASDESYQPVTAPFFEVTLQESGKPAESIKLRPVEETAGEFEGAIRPGATGFFTIASADPGHQATEATFQVVPAAVEREGPVDLAELEAVASVAGGQLFRTPQELLDGLERIPSMKATDVYRTPHSIWDSWVTLALIVSVLALEWWFRKWFNLL